MGDRHAPERAHDRVRRHEGLMRQEYDGQAELAHAGGGVAAHRGIVGAPRLVEWRAEHREEERHQPGRRQRAEAQQGPAERRDRQQRPADRQEHELCDLRGAAPQVVDDLPAREEREPVSLRSPRARHRSGEPWQQLPVAPDPAMLAAGEREVAGRVVVVDDHIGGEARTRVVPLDQVVRQQRVLGEAAVRRALEGLDVVDALSGEAALAVEVLVHVGDGGRIGVDARVSGMDGREDRPVRARQRHADARLQDPVAPDDAAENGVVHGAVERVRQGADQQRRRVGREHRVGIEGDDVADAPHRRHIPLEDAERLARAGEHEPVELGELAPLPLPPHPHALVRIPAARPMEEVERVLGVGGVPRVEGPHTLDRGGRDGLVVRAGLGGRVGEIAQHREVEVGLAVGQELDLEVLQRLAHGVDAAEEGGDHHRGAELGRDAVLVQVELRQRARREEGGDQLIHDVDGDVVGRDQAQEQHRQPLRAHHRAAQPQHRGERRERGRRHAAAEDSVRMAPHPAVDRLAPLRPIAGQALELDPAVVGNVVPDMLLPGSSGARVFPRRAQSTAWRATLSSLRRVRRAIRSIVCR